MSKSISITLPESLVQELQVEADELGVSRSRFISNILLDWQKKQSKVFDCIHKEGHICILTEKRCQYTIKTKGSCVVFDVVIDVM